MSVYRIVPYALLALIVAVTAGFGAFAGYCLLQFGSNGIEAAVLCFLLVIAIVGLTVWLWSTR